MAVAMSRSLIASHSETGMAVAMARDIRSRRQWPVG
jgi:hypothetical protein